MEGYLKLNRYYLENPNLQKKQIFKLCQAFSAHETFLQSESSFAHSDLAKKLMMQKKQQHNIDQNILFKVKDRIK